MLLCIFVLVGDVFISVILCKFKAFKLQFIIKKENYLELWMFVISRYIYSYYYLEAIQWWHGVKSNIDDAYCPTVCKKQKTWINLYGLTST